MREDSVAATGRKKEQAPGAAGTPFPVCLIEGGGSCAQHAGRLCGGNRQKKSAARGGGCTVDANQTRVRCCRGVVLPNLRLRLRTALALQSGLAAGRRSERNKNRLRGKAPISGNDFVVPDVSPAWGRGKSCGAEPGTNCRVHGRDHSGVANG